MILYHGSPERGLEVLKPSVSPFFGKPKQVCLAALRPMALLYGIRHFEYTYGFSDGRLFYEEYFPGAAEELYGGKPASLYLCAQRDGMEETSIPYEFISGTEVPVEEEIFIPDLYAALLEEERSGNIQIVRWTALSEDGRERVRRIEMQEILENRLLAEPDSPRARYMREKYPESWAMARKEMEDGR